MGAGAVAGCRADTGGAAEVVTRRRPERLAFRVTPAGLEIADTFSAARFKAKGLNAGDLVFAEIRKPRNPGYHRLAHALGQIVADNIDEFEGMDSHAALKRLQLEAGVGCESIAYKVNGMSIVQSIPLSLSFESMDQSEFESVFMGICRHIATNYWKDLDAEQVAAMAELMPND